MASTRGLTAGGRGGRETEGSHDEVQSPQESPCWWWVEEEEVSMPGGGEEGTTVGKTRECAGKERKKLKRTNKVRGNTMVDRGAMWQRVGRVVQLVNLKYTYAHAA